jgi:hypothetical protein
MVACVTQEPVTLLEGCLGPAIETVRTRSGSIDLACDLRREVLLVAVPASDASSDELTRAGVPLPAVEIV